MDADRMIQILEELILDPDTNPTARVTAIRCLREVQAEQPPKAGDIADLYEHLPRCDRRARTK